MAVTMRAVVVRSPGGPEVLELEDVPVPAVGPGDVRVAVRSIGINFRDVKQRQMEDPDSGFPFVPGSDFAGEVVEVGADVSAPVVGERVFGVALQGAYAEQIVIPAGLALPLGADADFDAGAIIPVAGLSASFLLSVSGLAAGQTAATWAAAGGLGCFLGGLLQAAGVRSIGLTSSPAKAEVARAAGHADVVDYTAGDPVEAVQKLTEGAGVDVVFDSVAGPDFARSFRMLRNEGMVVLCGRAAGDPDLGALHDDFVGVRRNLGLREFYLATHIVDHLDEVPGRAGELAAGLRDGRLAVPVTSFPLEDVARAHEQLERGATVGKLVLHPQ